MPQLCRGINRLREVGHLVQGTTASQASKLRCLIQGLFLVLSVGSKCLGGVQFHEKGKNRQKEAKACADLKDDRSCSREANGPTQPFTGRWWPGCGTPGSPSVNQRWGQGKRVFGTSGGTSAKQKAGWTPPGSGTLDSTPYSFQKLLSPFGGFPSG